MASGNTIHEWNGEWKAVYRADHPELQGITRIALNPAGDRIALVSTTGDETTIRNTRATSNTVLGIQDAAGAASVLAQDVKITTSRGVVLEGREAVEKALAAEFEQQKDLVYVRTPSAVEVKGDTATERGSWRGSWTGENGSHERHGTYTATWRKAMTPNGTPAWVIAEERFVLEGEGMVPVPADTAH
jgi:ketosteroid isomerase-like protein